MVALAPRSRACPICGESDLRATVELHDVPTQDGVLWRTEAEARESPLGDIRLVLCETCSFVWNELHDPARVGFRGYDVSLQHSPTFQAFVAELAERLIGRYDLHGKTILDVGCGRGHFLEEICARGPNAGIGIDPSIESRRVCSPDITFVGEAYSDELLDLQADLFVCRHVLDILGDQVSLVRLLGRAVDRAAVDAAVYVEVPNAMATFGDLVVWNLVYEHRAWFVADSLRYLFALEGFDVTDVAPCWHGEYLGLEARRTGAVHARPVPAEESGVGAALDRFSGSFERVREEWQLRLDELAGGGQRAVVWGAGARGIAFLSLLDAGEVVPVPRRREPEAAGAVPASHGAPGSGSGASPRRPARPPARLEPDLCRRDRSSGPRSRRRCGAGGPVKAQVRSASGRSER